MARKFWERQNANILRFYDQPDGLDKTELLARITDIQTILSLPMTIKEILIDANPVVSDEQGFDTLYNKELEELADRVDYWDYTQVDETFTVIESGWWSPSTATLGPGTIESVSSEVVGNEAINSIDGTPSTEWMSDDLGGPHEIVFGWQYIKKFDGIRFRVGAVVGNPQAWEGVSVWIANSVGGLDNPNNLALDNVDVEVAGTLADPWLELTFPKNEKGRFCRITITGTGRADNRADAGEIELRALTFTVEE